MNIWAYQPYTLVYGPVLDPLAAFTIYKWMIPKLGIFRGYLIVSFKIIEDVKIIKCKKNWFDSEEIFLQ